MESRQEADVKQGTDALRISVRRLGLGDAAILTMLCEEDADFDVEGRSKPVAALSAEATAEYLADRSVLHWVAEAEGQVVGHLSCCLVRKRAGDPVEVLLCVRSRYRRRGVGCALVHALNDWMTARAVKEVWVVADNPVAVAFYASAGVAENAAVYMSR